MTAPLSPAFSEVSVTFCCSEEGTEGNADSDHCSPELKRAKRLDSAQPSFRFDESLKKKFRTSKCMNGLEESESHLSFRSICNSFPGMERNGNSNHSLPALDFKASSAQFVRRLSLEDVQCDKVGSEDKAVQFERRPSLDEGLDLCYRAGDEAVEMKNCRKTRVVSSYCSHLKENQQLVGSDQSSQNTDLTVSTQPSRFVDSNECFTGNDCSDKGPVQVKFGLSEMTCESGEERIRKILMPLPLETLIGSREHYETWSTANSLQEDDGVPSGLNPAETAEPDSEATGTVRTPDRNAGDSQTWNSHIEKEYKNELEFSTLVTLAYVRVRDLTNSIDRACNYLETIEKKDSEETQETNELRSEIQAAFEERANLALEHSKWRSEFSDLYLQRKKVLSNLKYQAASAEESYFKLRKELEDMQNEPVVAKPKRTWFSRLCAFMK